MRPVEVTDLDIAFGGDTKRLMPPYETIPKEFKDGHTEWNKLFSDWFHKGLKSLDMEPKDDIDIKKAIRHIMCVMGSFEPKHEHKAAAVAYLLSEWFTNPKWEVSEGKVG